jgi:hypothetical protein
MWAPETTVWTFLLTLAVLVLTGLGLAVGLLLRGRPLERGCGGTVRTAGGARCPGCARQSGGTDEEAR